MSYSNGLLPDQSYQTANKYVQRGLPGVGFKFTVAGDYDMQNKKLTNVKSGTDSNDAVNKSQLDATTNLLHGSRAGDVVNDKAVIYSNTGAVHANSLYFEDPSDQGNSNEVRIMTEHQSYPNIHLNIPDLHNFDGHGGRPKSELMVTSVEQTVTGKKVFENIEVHDPTSNNQAANKSYADTKLSLTGGTMTGDLILPHHNYPIPGNTNKAISYESQREIFMSRQESFPMQADINMNNNFIQNIATPTSSHQVTNKGYCDYNFLNRQKGGRIMGSLSMNQNDLFEIPAPKYESSAANKNYVDNQMGTKADLSKTTTQTFQGRVQVPDFNSGGHNGSDIVNLRYIDGIFLNKKTGGTLNNPITFLSSLPSNQRQIHNIGSPQFISSAANKQYVDGEISKIPVTDSSPFLKIDGSRAMTDNLDMGTHKIINVGQPTTVTDAATKGYIDKTLAESHLLSSHKSNEFKYLDDPNETSSEYNITIDAFTDFNESPHKNKKAFQITLTKDVGTNDYRSRMGFNLYPLPLGTYTIIFEYYFPENTNIQLSCQSTTAYVHKQIQKDFTDYSKLLVQINNNSKTTPDYLFFTIHGTAVVNNPEGYIIVYGVKDWSDSVDPNIYDDGFYVQMFQYKNGDMQIQTDIDMNTHKIENLSDATNTKDAINKGQLDAYKALNDEIFTNNNSKMKILTELDMDNNKIINLKNAVNKNDVINKGQLDIVLNKLNELIPHIKNYRYRAIFKENFYDLTETHNFVLKSNVNNVIIQRVKPNLNIDTDLPISSFSSNGLLFNHRIRLYYLDMYNSHTPVTFFMSFIHNTQKTGTIFFSHEAAPTRPTFPTFLITPDKIVITINQVRHEHSIPADLINKKIFIWICYQGGVFGNPVSKMSIGNDQSYIQGGISRGRSPSHTLSIDYDVIVNKIGIINRFYDINSPEHHQIILEEKLNGTKLI